DAGGRLLLRIEDIDLSRCRPEFDDAILEDLAWLGLVWETPVRRQSEHMDDYRAAIDRLREDGLLYRCFRTRAELAEASASAPHGLPPPFLGEALPQAEEARRLAAGEPSASHSSKPAPAPTASAARSSRERTRPATSSSRARTSAWPTTSPSSWMTP